MEELNKTQLILLALLLSFVTSIATGIVTVTLMDQAPPGVTQTINKVVQTTVEKVVPGEQKTTTITKEIIVSEANLIVEAIEKNAGSVARVGMRSFEGAGPALDRLGVVLSADGAIVTSGNDIDSFIDPMVFYDRALVPASILARDRERGLILLAAATSTLEAGEGGAEKRRTIAFKPATLSDKTSVKLGETLAAIGGREGATAASGIVSELGYTAREDEKTGTEQKQLSAIYTTIPLGRESFGGPLLDLSGQVAGIMVFRSGTVAGIPASEVKAFLGEAAAKEDTGVQSATVFATRLPALIKLIAAWGAEKPSEGQDDGAGE